MNQEPEVRRTKSGRWSILCKNCGRRHSAKHSDDYVWCPTCRAECGKLVYVFDVVGTSI